MLSGISSLIPSVTQLGTAASGTSAAQGSPSSFADVFEAAAGDVDSLQNGADQQVMQMLHNGGNVDVSKTMVSVEKADVAFQLMLQVRNKVVSAYQEMEKMQF